MDFYKFRHPFTCMVSGPTMSGKTILVRRLLQHFNELISIKTNKLNVLWAYGQWQELFNQNIINVSVQYLPGLPSSEDLKDIQIVVIDDLMNDLGDNKSFADLFTKGSTSFKLKCYIHFTKSFSSRESYENNRTELPLHHNNEKYKR